MPDSVTVATSGTVNRHDVCEHCKTSLVYRVDAQDRPVAMFCPNMAECYLALKEWHLKYPIGKTPGVPVPEAKASETTSDNAARLLYDLCDAAGIIGQSLRMCTSKTCKDKGAELIALWRRGEHLGVLNSERP